MRIETFLSVQINMVNMAVRYELLFYWILNKISRNVDEIATYNAISSILEEFINLPILAK